MAHPTFALVKKTKVMKFFIYSVFMLLSLTAVAQSPIGIWKTIDDNSGEARSHVEIYEKEGMLFGKISKLLHQDPSIICDNCKGDKKINLF